MAANIPNSEGSSNPAVLSGGQFGAVIASTLSSSDTPAAIVQGDLNVQGALTMSAVEAFGYSTGAGGAVTQATNKSTGVTLSKPCGQITMHNANLSTLTAVSFTLTNTLIAATDVVAVSIGGGVTTGGSYFVIATPAAGSAVISVVNLTAGTLGEAIVLNFAVIKSVAA